MTRENTGGEHLGDFKGEWDQLLRGCREHCQDLEETLREEEVGAAPGHKPDGSLRRRRCAPSRRPRASGRGLMEGVQGPRHRCWLPAPWLLFLPRTRTLTFGGASCCSELRIKICSLFCS